MPQRSVILPDPLYVRLEAEARQRGVSVDTLVETTLWRAFAAIEASPPGPANDAPAGDPEQVRLKVTRLMRQMFTQLDTDQSGDGSTRFADSAVCSLSDAEWEAYRDRHLRLDPPLSQTIVTERADHRW